MARDAYTKDPEYHCWRAMLARCNNPNATGYSNYGGRGIRVCPQWLTDFRTFVADVGPRPSMDHSIDRIDNDGHYEPSNVKWSTTEEQNRHKRSLIYITINGETACLAEWARRNGLSEEVIWHRIKTSGWDPVKAATAPVGSSRRTPRVKSNSFLLTVGGETMNVTEWSRRTGIGVATIWQRVRNLGWSHERAVTVARGNRWHKAA